MTKPHMPEDVKAAFDEVACGENNNCVFDELMPDAIEEKRRIQRRAQAIDYLLSLRKDAPKVSDSMRELERQALRREGT